MPSLNHRLKFWSLYKRVLFTLFILLLGACHILTYCSSLSLPPLNPGMTNFQGHSFKTSVTHHLPSIIYSPLHEIRLSCLGSQQPHSLHILSHAPKNFCSFINYALLIIRYHPVTTSRLNLFLCAVGLLCVLFTCFKLFLVLSSYSASKPQDCQ